MKKNILAAEIMEEQIDTEMKKMDELDDDDIEKIRQRRLKAMQKAHQAKQVCLGCKPFREKKCSALRFWSHLNQVLNSSVF